MAKVLYSATMSLDGFIAGPGGDMSWMKPFFEPDEETDELAADIGALLVGNRTHRGDDPNRGTQNEGAFGGTWDGPYFLLTHHPAPSTPEPGVTVVHDLESGLTAAKAAAGDKYVGILGADVARQCLEIGALDEVMANIVPIFLGDGTPLFSYPGGKQVRLEQTKVSHARTWTSIWARVVR